MGLGYNHGQLFYPWSSGIHTRGEYHCGVRTKLTTVVEGSFEISGTICALPMTFLKQPHITGYIDSRRASIANNANSFARQVYVVIPLCRVPRVPMERVDALDILWVYRSNKATDGIKYNFSVTLDRFARGHILYFEMVSLRRRIPLGILDQVSEFRARLEFVLVPEVHPVSLYFELTHVVR